MLDLNIQAFETLLELAVSSIEEDSAGRGRDSVPLARKPAGEIARKIQAAHAVAGPSAAGANDLPVRPRHRPPVPVLTVLDDGSLDSGQEIRIRSDSFLIGRTSGDLVIANDTTLSGQHVQIGLLPDGDRKAWTLTDLGSSNHTFVRVRAAALQPGAVVLIGSRRLQLRPAACELLVPLRPDATCPLPRQPTAGEAWDSLVELPGTPSQARFQLPHPRMLIGRDAAKCQISLDDPALAGVHAELVRRADGLWVIQARPSRNGVWVAVNSLRLASGCFFQCGEQRFRFVLP